MTMKIISHRDTIGRPSTRMAQTVLKKKTIDLSPRMHTYIASELGE